MPKLQAGELGFAIHRKDVRDVLQVVAQLRAVRRSQPLPRVWQVGGRLAVPGVLRGLGERPKGSRREGTAFLLFVPLPPCVQSNPRVRSEVCTPFLLQLSTPYVWSFPGIQSRCGRNFLEVFLFSCCTESNPSGKQGPRTGNMFL